jgi:hypothetical protein
MKNFLDLLATDLHLDLVLGLEPVGIPDSEIWINQILVHQGPITQPILVMRQLPLTSGFAVSIKLKNKIYTADQEVAIVLNRLCVDDFDVIPNHTHLARYVNDHNVDSPTSYLGFNGEWRLEITQPFYQWQHQVTGQGWLLQPKFS